MIWDLATRQLRVIKQEVIIVYKNTVSNSGILPTKSVAAKQQSHSVEDNREGNVHNEPLRPECYVCRNL